MFGRWIFAVFTLSLLGSCAGNSLDSAHNGDQRAAVYPNIPDDPYVDPDVILARQTSVDFSTTISGKDPIAYNPRYVALIQDTAYIGMYDEQQPAISGDIRWVEYSFSGLTPYQTPEFLQINYIPHGQPKGGGHIYVGVADFAQQRWQFSSFDTGQSSKDNMILAPLNNNVDFYSPSGNMYVVLIGDGVDVIKDLRLVRDEPLPPPMNVTASQGTLEGAVVLNWSDPGITYDPDGDGPGTFDYSYVEGSYSLTGDVDDPAWGSCSGGNPGQTTAYFQHDDLPAGTQVWFRFRLIKEGPGERFEGRWSAPVSGYIGFPPVPSFTVTPDSGDGYTELTLGTDSYDPDGGSIVKYYWTLSNTTEYIYREQTTADPLTVTADMTGGDLRVELRVRDDDGQEATAVWWVESPSDGIVVDDPNQLDPSDPSMVFGGAGAYTARLRFITQHTGGMAKIEFDSWYDGDFRSNNGVPFMLLKDYSTPPNLDGPKDFTANIPAAQPPGQYWFAVRVTDNSNPPRSEVYIWPGLVTLPGS
jgi:hypothetical protein